MRTMKSTQNTIDECIEHIRNWDRVNISDIDESIKTVRKLAGNCNFAPCGYNPVSIDDRIMEALYGPIPE